MPMNCPKAYATLLAEQLAVHLAGHGVDLSALVWQTDNGGELLARIFHQSGAKRICGAKWKRDGEGVLKTLIFSQRGHSPPYPRG